MLKLFLIPILFISVNALATTCIPNNFTTLFFERNDSLINEFTMEENGYTATFSGGLANDMLSPGNVTWNILPLGASISGTSAGEASVSMSPSADYINTALYSGINAIGRIQLIGAQGSLVQEFSFSNGSYVDVLWFQEEGGPLVSHIKIIIDGGTDVSYLTNYSYSSRTLAQPCEVQSGAVGPLATFLLILYAIVMICTTNKCSLRNSKL